MNEIKFGQTDAVLLLLVLRLVLYDPLAAIPEARLGVVQEFGAVDIVCLPATTLLCDYDGTGRAQRNEQCEAHWGLQHARLQQMCSKHTKVSTGFCILFKDLMTAILMLVLRRLLCTR